MYGLVQIPITLRRYFSPSGDHLTGLAFRDIPVEREAYRACFQRYFSPDGSLQILLYESLLSEWKLTELALRVIISNQQ